MKYITYLKIDIVNFFNISELDKIKIDHLYFNIRNKEQIIKYKDQIIKNDLITKSILSDRTATIYFYSILNEKEVISINNPKLSYLYAYNIIKDRWPEGEKIILRDPEFCILYAKKVLQDRWPEAEKIILKDSYYSLQYAKDVIDGPWPEGEDSIIMDAHDAYVYFTDVINDRWEKGEPVIMNSELRSEYLDNLKYKGYDTSELEAKYPK